MFQVLRKYFPAITGSAFFQITQNEKSGKYEKLIFCERHLTQSSLSF